MEIEADYIERVMTMENEKDTENEVQINWLLLTSGRFPTTDLDDESFRLCSG